MWMSHVTSWRRRFTSLAQLPFCHSDFIGSYLESEILKALAKCPADQVGADGTDVADRAKKSTKERERWSWDAFVEFIFMIQLFLDFGALSLVWVDPSPCRNMSQLHRWKWSTKASNQSMTPLAPCTMQQVDASRLTGWMMWLWWFHPWILQVGGVALSSLIAYFHPSKLDDDTRNNATIKVF